jgi:DNA-binding response OmpR family regulator
MEKKKKILLVEDEFYIRLNIKLMLELENFDVIDVLNGLEALPYINNEDFDAVITDVMMYGMDGIDLLARLRAHPKTSTVPVFFITAKPERELTNVIQANENIHFIAKPFSFSVLFEKLNEVLK